MHKFGLIVMFFSILVYACAAPAATLSPTSAPTATAQPSATPTAIPSPTAIPEPTTPPEPFWVNPDTGQLEIWNEKTGAYELVMGENGVVVTGDSITAPDERGWQMVMADDQPVAVIVNPETGETYKVTDGGITVNDVVLMWKDGVWVDALAEFEVLPGETERVTLYSETCFLGMDIKPEYKEQAYKDFLAPLQADFNLDWRRALDMPGDIDGMISWLRDHDYKTPMVVKDANGEEVWFKMLQGNHWGGGN